MTILAHSRHSGTHEQLIAALLPDATAPLSTPQPAPMPSLPAPSPLRVDSLDALLLSAARLDRSGRVHERILLRALGWEPGHELALDTIDNLIVIRSLPGGGHHVGDRCTLALPAAARRLSGITIESPVVLVAAVHEQVLLVHPSTAVARLLAAHHPTLNGTPDAR